MTATIQDKETTRDREKTLAKVELNVYPPLSYKMSSNKVGAYTIEEEICRDETLGDLLSRLANANREAWRNIFNVETGEMRPGILAIINDNALAWTKAPEKCLSDSDRIDFRITYCGG